MIVRGRRDCDESLRFVKFEPTDDTDREMLEKLCWYFIKGGTVTVKTAGCKPRTWEITKRGKK